MSKPLPLLALPPRQFRPFKLQFPNQPVVPWHLSLARPGRDCPAKRCRRVSVHWEFPLASAGGARPRSARECRDSGNSIGHCGSVTGRHGGRGGGVSRPGRRSRCRCAGQPAASHDRRPESVFAHPVARSPADSRAVPSPASRDRSWTQVRKIHRRRCTGSSWLQDRRQPDSQTHGSCVRKLQLL